ncbi:MAG: sugar transferase [Streptococcaceae bacterium]|jgi:lipopolysaccharide/colanic/teichoic acid biosynthesis glycosyltransferase|nr:sugar transferase [Streptococcaceae bacterium]
MQKVLKRVIDIIFSLILLVLFFPTWVIIAILIKFTSPGKVFFIQDRPGQYKKIFKIYKFRTMRLGSGQMIKGQEVMKDDDRVTLIGKFLRRSKIDESPQLLNVIKGEMSLVGPRPERIASLEEYDNEISKRLNMKPGMTGLAQIRGNIYLDLQDRYKLDVSYVEHHSLLLDAKIIFRTIGVIMFGEERYLDKCLVDLNPTSGEDV